MATATTDTSAQLGQFVQLAEAKRIAASVMNTFSESDHARLVITSPLAGEGKTMLAAGLAMQAADNFNRRVLVMEVHWRKPRLHACFQLEQNFDDSKLEKADQVLDYVQKTQTPGVEILTAPQGTQADQTSKGLNLSLEILDKASAEYDLVIMDTGPLFPPNRFMLDPMNFASKADGTLMVLLGGVTPRDTAKRASTMFQSSGAKLLGVVMNQWQNPLFRRK